MQYVDVMSLYQWVCWYFKLPIGIPTIYLDYVDIPTMLAKGLLHCTVLRPPDSYHSVLLYSTTDACYFVYVDLAQNRVPRHNVGEGSNRNVGRRRSEGRGRT